MILKSEVQRLFSSWLEQSTSDNNLETKQQL